MSFLSLRKLGIKFKVLMPSMFYVLLLIFVATLTYRSRALINEFSSQQKALGALESKANSFSTQVRDFIQGEISLEELDTPYEELSDSVRTTQTGLDFAPVWKGLKEINTLNLQNQAVEEQITELTNSSIQQSNGYIEQVAKKLADEQSRQEVSTLERLVIIGANMNTTASYEVRVRFAKLKESMNTRDDILSYLDALLENVERDVERLKDTPFAQMPVQAMEANLAIKNLTKQFISNSENLIQLRGEVISNLDTAVSKLQSTTSQNSQNILEQLAGFFYFFALLLALLSLVGIFLSYMLARSLSQAILKTCGFAQAVAEGDLTGHIDLNRQDELGQLAQALNRMGESLRSILGAVSETSGQVANSSRVLSSSAQELSTGASQQAASLEETSASIEELASSVQQNADNANQADDIAGKSAEAVEMTAKQTLEANSVCGEAVQLAREGGEAVKSMVIAMNEMSDSSQKIADIIRVIDDIADQTNLLALNAAIEAARAGEMGKGFAVVAVEVRKLAERSQQAAKEISGMISGSVKQVQEGVSLANQCGDSLSKIVESISQVAETIQSVSQSSQQQVEQIHKTAELVQSISAACTEQSSGTEQIVKALAQLDEVTQQNASSADKTAGASEELSGQARSMQELVRPFRIKDSEPESEPNPQSQPVLEQQSGVDPPQQVQFFEENQKF